MSKPVSSPLRDNNDLVAELRRVDDAFAQLRPSRDDAFDALLDEDPVARGAARSRTPLFAGAAALALCGAVAFALWPSTSTSATMVAQTPTTTTPTTTPTTPPTAVATDDGRAAPQAPSTTQPTQPSTTTTQPLTPLRLVALPKANGTGPLWAQRDPVQLKRLELNNRLKGTHTTVDDNAVGVGAATDTVGDDEVEAALRTAAAKRRAGDFAGAAATLGEVLQQNPPARVADTLGFERAQLLEKAGAHADSCAALARHAARFPNSKNARDVAALRAACP